MEKLKLLKPKNKKQRNEIVCALIGHSMIQKTWFGYYDCARCGMRMGDTLGDVYPLEDVVIVGHNCKKCKTNYKKLTWKDKLYCPDPFKAP